ncbi:MAG: type II toxin-antitoxin system VapC family toxin [Chloroflexi bacterium]|nr:type II toxin-antitoxin system VapC family toxin [Chloroflexota bacterium]
MILFIDTWGWINIFNRRESQHREVSRYYQDLRNRGATIVTSDYVLDEVYTLLFKRLPTDLASNATKIIANAIDDGYLDLVWITPDRFETARELRYKYQDKPDISFTDLTTIVVMRELGISDILTGDAHFTHVGMGFILHP